MKKIGLVVLTVGIISSAFSQVKTRTFLDDKNLVPREHNVDMLHMKLEVEFEPEKWLVKGKVSHTFSPIQKQIDSLFLDAPGITIKSVMVDGKDTKFDVDPAGVTIRFAEKLQWETTHKVELQYEATPRKGIYFIGWNDPKNLARKQIWTQGQGIDNRHWIPMYDEMNDKLTTEIIVKFDNKYQVLSNGNKLKEKDNKDGTKTWHYKMTKPHAPYLVMLGIGQYKVKSIKSKSGVPIHLWYYPDWEANVKYTYMYSAEMMDFFEKEIGVKYPWETYSQIPVADFMYGAMENTSATLFGDFYHVDARGHLDKPYIGVNAHELAHQWFGDMVTARASAHHWLQESFATYYNMMYERIAFGQDFYDWDRREATNKSLEESKKNFRPIAHSQAGTTRHYPKGAHVLHMLKYVVGKEEYNKAVKHYLTKHSYKNVDSEDLLVAFHETLGYSLDWFWNQWVYRGGEPHYQVSLQNILEEKGGQFTEFSIKQIHERNEVVGLFKMPFDFEVNYTDGTKDAQRIIIEKEQHTVKIANPNKKKIAYVLFDPNSEVMKKVSFNKPFEMLRLQGLNASNMLDRYDAVVAMRDIDFTAKLEALLAIWIKETWWAIKGEIISQLANQEHLLVLKMYQEAITSNDSKLKLELLEHVNTIPTSVLPDFEKLLVDSSYYVVEKALEKLCFLNPDKTADYLEITKNEKGFRGLNIRCKWLEIAYSSTQEQRYADELVNYVSNSYEFQNRYTAAKALKSINYFNEELLKNLLNAITSPNGRLARPCGEVLQHFYDQTRFKKQIQSYVNSQKWKGFEKETIEAYL